MRSPASSEGIRYSGCNPGLIFPVVMIGSMAGGDQGRSKMPTALHGESLARWVHHDWLGGRRLPERRSHEA